MAVLVLKLSGPLQSWGTSVKLRNHETDSMPSKSGVVGIIAAALGRKRNDDISDLRRLRFGVRADAPGSGILHDWHVAHTYKEDGSQDKTYTGIRDYLQDACFVAGLEGSRDDLEKYADALFHPVFPPYLGRKSCVPDCDLVYGVCDGTLEDVFESLPALSYTVPSGPVRVCVESPSGDRMRQDNPLSFDPYNRKYSYRMEKEYYVTLPEADGARE